MKADEPHINVTHCLLLKHALARKTLPRKLAKVLRMVVECVNNVRNSAMKRCIFEELCNEVGARFEVFSCYSNVRWIFPGKVLNRVFALHVELALFFPEQQHRHADCFKNSELILIFMYMADVVDALNHHN